MIHWWIVIAGYREQTVILARMSMFIEPEVGHRFSPPGMRDVEIEAVIADVGLPQHYFVRVV